MVGRDRELEVLLDCLEKAASGHGQLAVIEGEAGVGKTRLTTACLSAASDHGFEVCCGGGHELARDRPFGVLTDALGVVQDTVDDDRARVAALVAADAGPGAGLRFRILEEIEDLVEALARRRPLVLVLEDLHWADTSTLLTADRLARRVSSLPVVLIVTCRPTPRPTEVASVLETCRQHDAHALMLGPLDPPACTELAAAALGAPPVRTLDQLLAQAGGNPFYLLELLAALEEEHAIDVREDVAEATHAVTPASLRVVVLRRLSFLSEPALNALQLASVLGTTFTLEELSAVSKIPAAGLLPAVTELVRAGVVGETRDQLVFRHELVRDAVYHDLPASVRRDLHREAGHLLAGVGARAEKVASQMALGATIGDAEVVSWLRRAARESLSRDPQAAAELLGQAAEVVGPDAGLHAVLGEERVEALLWAGQHRKAEEAARLALAELGEAAMDAVLRRGLAQALFLQGRVAEAAEEVEHVVRAQGLPASFLPRALAEATGAAMLAGDLHRAAGFAEQALEGSFAGTDQAVDCLAVTLLAWIAHLRGQFDRSAALTDRAMLEAERTAPGAALYGNPHLFLGAFLAGSVDNDKAEQLLRDGRHGAEEAGAVWDMPVYHTAKGILHLWRGNWGDAWAEIETSLGWADEHGSTLGVAWPLSVRARLEVHRGELVAAEATMATAGELLGVGRLQLGAAWLLWARAELQEAQGDPEAAIASLEAAARLADALGIVSQYLDIGPDLVRLLMRAGRPDRAAEVASTIEAVGAGHELSFVRSAVLRARGLADDDPDLLVTAMEQFEVGPRPVAAVFVAEEAADALCRADRRDEALVWLQRAVDGYERLGATWDLGRAEASMRRLGVRRGRRGPRAKTSTGWDSLSTTERQVVALVAAGLTNRQIGEQLFISARTVETHLSHVFAKLGVTSRVEVAAAAGRRSSHT